jgi:outer membrane immunogenic protein
LLIWTYITGTESLIEMRLRLEYNRFRKMQRTETGEDEMKKFLLGTVALFALGSVSAVAADLPARTYTKAPVYAAPVYNWTGIYVGAHIGGAFNDSNGIGVAGFTTNSNRGSFLGGGQIGADYQFSPNWLVGIEGNVSGLDRSNRSFLNAGGAGFVDRGTDWLASVTGRLGYVWGPGVIYGKGGVAFRDNNSIAAFTAPGVATPSLVSRNDTGYTVGGGVEYMFAPAWSAKLEYQYYNFDNTGVIVPAVAGLAAPGVSYRDDLHTVKLGVNYHFNWGGPVVAKY